MSRRQYDDDRYDNRDHYYERRDRDYDARPHRGYEELEIDIERERVERRPARAASVISERRAPRQPDFLREDYNRPTAGALVVTEKVKEYERERGKSDVSVIGSRRGGAPPPDRVVKEDIVIKERIRDDRSDSGKSRRSTVSRAPPYPRDDGIPDGARVEYRERVAERPYREVEEEDIIIRTRGRDISPPPGPRRDYSPPPRRKDFVEGSEVQFRPRRHEVEREEIVIREGRPPPPIEREVERHELVVRERESPPRRYERTVEIDEIDIRERERSRPPPRTRSIGPPIAREREEFVFRRRPSPSPPSTEREQIIIRRREVSPPPAPIPRTPTPEPEPIILRDPSPEPIPLQYRPPVIQHIYTHHHHIDHGIERAPSPVHLQLAPPRSPTPPPPAIPPPAPVKAKEESLEIEIRRRGTRNGGDKYYERDIIVDRERDTFDRVREDMQVARRRSVSSRPSRHDDIRRDSGPRLRRDMWTEVTKDLVIKEAIERQGYDYEETDKFFYVIEYLKYEDVLRLVEISEDLKRERRERLKDKKWIKEDSDRASITGGGSRYDERERIVEHEHIYDSREIRRNGRYR
ncbi:SAC3 family protein 1 [Sphaceloma murrayae]|uniref:SAC3 family protein 1 n=1 Tax=Sphaceloma murrayae TaxID=2082308 RepID=A0A2K1QSE0_9PEZI|nr:SAC3 family protein 1 [Sphaceloma murrayae]